MTMLPTLESFERINKETSSGLARLVQKFRNPETTEFSLAELKLMENPLIQARVEVEAHIDWIQNPRPDEMTFREFEEARHKTFATLFGPLLEEI